MAQLLMPKATAVWLVENTTLTFQQIAEFCGLHELEVQAIADGEVAGGMQGLDPVQSGQLTKEEIAKGQADPAYRLQIAVPSVPLPEPRARGARYTPVAKRSDRPDAIAWLLKNHSELSDAQISRLVGTTKNTIAAVRDRTHWNTPNIRPQSPVLLGICSHEELEKAVAKARERLHKAAESKPAAAGKPAAPGKPAVAGTPAVEEKPAAGESEGEVAQEPAEATSAGEQKAGDDARAADADQPAAKTDS